MSTNKTMRWAGEFPRDNISTEKAYSHTGSCGAWAAVVWVVPEKDITFVAASNYGGAEGFAACSDAINLMIESFIGPTGVAAN